jgi:hypothetical protein
LITTYERGVQQGILQEKRQTTLWLLEWKFGPVAAEVRQWVETLTAEQLDQIALTLATAPPQKELYLGDLFRGDGLACAVPPDSVPMPDHQVDGR